VAEEMSGKESLTIKVFTLKTCPNCPIAKKIGREVAEKFNVGFMEIDVGTPEGQIEGLMYQVMSTPGIAINDEVVARGAVLTREELEKKVREKLG